ncbi:phosphoglycerate dehydrogenase-like enzyme [Natronobacillus azotifigens]|uniref:D-2-hydroxyacid dehydrogenase n=1 Tax=Natronobacillus azotifigens TaxID=472978 RepID=A0A9J6RFH3_9BACI|nr:D-2-hydroxyacid dehydrogenase [Natronobacillus azotifigens]MCZ0704148.1 D-2-hydroxyacid dehydrogenase [Natronobacillus azotifigens]
MTMTKIKTHQITPSIYFRSSISDQHLQKLRGISERVIVDPWEMGETEPEPSADLSDCNIIFTLGLTDDLSILKKAPNVKWVQSHSVGVDAMLHEETINQDIIITNARGCTSIPIAEHTIAMITSFAKQVPTLLKHKQQQNWEKAMVKDLSGSTIAIIGYGQIGSEIAKRCKAFDMHVVGCRRNPSQNNPENDYADLIVGMDQVNDVLGKADFVVLALPATEETDDFLDRERLKVMKPGSVLINVGRGNAVVEPDLVESLRAGHLAGAALDVFDVEPLPDEHPFWHMDNVIISPHQAYLSPKNTDRIIDLFYQNIKRFIAGDPLLNVVNKVKGY